MNELEKAYNGIEDAIGSLDYEGNYDVDTPRESLEYIKLYINNLQSKIYNANLFKLFLQERLLELKDNIERGVADFDARNECEYILEQFIYFIKDDKDETNNNN